MKKCLLFMFALMLSVNVMRAEIYSGNYGSKIHWIFDTETGALTISGTGMLGPEMVMGGGNPNIFKPVSANMIKTVRIEEGITAIGPGVFYGCANMTSVTIPNSVTEIYAAVFWRCPMLTSVTVPSNARCGMYAFKDVLNVVYYGNDESAPWDAVNMNAFIDGDLLYADETKTTLVGCSRTVVGRITIPNSVTNIKRLAFAYCTGLTSVTIPSSVQSIGNEAFSEVLNVIYSGEATGSPWKALAVNGYFDGYLLYKDATKKELVGCIRSAKGDIVIPNSVTNIGDYAFKGCIGLTSVVIPNSVTQIGYEAFAGCSGLTFMTIGTGVAGVGISMSSDCINLKTVCIFAEEPPSIEFGYPFDTENPDDIHIFVPEASVQAYKEHSVWGEYNIQPIDGYSLIVSCNNAEWGSVTGISLYRENTEATLVATANRGCRFIQWSDGNTANPRNIIVTKDTAFTAIFEAIKYTLTLTSNDATMGLVSDGGQYVDSTETTLTATAKTGYHFQCWSDGNTTNPRTIQITQDTILMALFAKDGEDMLDIDAITSSSVTVVLLDTLPAGFAQYKLTISLANGDTFAIHLLDANGNIIRRLQGSGRTQTTITIPNLTPNTTYTYTLDVLDEHGNIIGRREGTFRTLGESSDDEGDDDNETALPIVEDEASHQSMVKVLLNGQILVLTPDGQHTLDGKRLK